mmetsp:Transcript_29091/g.49606  ORF Transcript_29091/g.49606 Transcript_29091/m.49606 type:complete len:209 (+) Transcript_29091:1804-2430(+)
MMKMRVCMKRSTSSCISCTNWRLTAFLWMSSHSSSWYARTSALQASRRWSFKCHRVSCRWSVRRCSSAFVSVSHRRTFSMVLNSAWNAVTSDWFVSGRTKNLQNCSCSTTKCSVARFRRCRSVVKTCFAPLLNTMSMLSHCDKNSEANLASILLSYSTTIASSISNAPSSCSPSLGAAGSSSSSFAVASAAVLTSFMRFLMLSAYRAL